FLVSVVFYFVFILFLTFSLSIFFFFTDTATTEFYTLSLHDALPISGPPGAAALAESLPLRRPGLVFVTYPDYYGLAVDGRELVERARGLPVLADEAHGAHFRFCPGAPEPALEWGAAVSVQSTHKMLAALTQASMLHVRERGKELLGRIARALSLFQTTS